MNFLEGALIGFINANLLIIILTCEIRYYYEEDRSTSFRVCLKKYYKSHLQLLIIMPIFMGISKLFNETNKATVIVFILSLILDKVIYCIRKRKKNKEIGNGAE